MIGLVPARFRNSRNTSRWEQTAQQPPEKRLHLDLEDGATPLPEPSKQPPRPTRS